MSGLERHVLILYQDDKPLLRADEVAEFAHFLLAFQPLAATAIGSGAACLRLFHQLLHVGRLVGILRFIKHITVSICILPKVRILVTLKLNIHFCSIG